ncbi:MAG: Uma2 family endonuclease [Candidatus Poribacteria bacterium]|nr:Uma2 family endonuclease [Candidatus Poribacteria bacterium]
MSSLSARTLYTPEEYLFMERKAALKSEYLSGEILAMSGASLAHTRITLDIAIELDNQLKGKECEVVTNDLRVKTSPMVAYFYPDVVIFCGEPELEDDTFDTLLNPVVIIEVLSPSTEVYDRGEKFEYYQQIPSLKEYILVSQDKVDVEHYHLQGTQWNLKEFYALQDTLTLSSIGCKLPLRDIYTRVDFD